MEGAGLLLSPKKWKLVERFRAEEETEEGLFTFLLWNGRTCPDLPHTAAADREIKMFAEAETLGKSPARPFSGFLSKQTVTKQKVEAFQL